MAGDAPDADAVKTARVYVQRDDVQVRVDGEWYVLDNGEVWVHYPSGGWSRSVLSIDTITGGGDWVEKAA